MVDADACHSNLSKAEFKDIVIPGYLAGVEREFARGFNLREAAMTISARVDPYFDLYASAGPGRTVFIGFFS
jgi:hypothetical protein